MGAFNIVLMQADFSSNYLKKGTPIIASEETADAILSQLKETNESIEDALRLFFYRLKQSGIFPKVKNLVLPCVSSDLDEARRNWMNTSDYEEGVSYSDYGGTKGLVFESINKTIHRGGSVQAATNTIVNPSSSLLAGNITACFCTKGHKTEYLQTTKTFISLSGLQYSSLQASNISLYQNSSNNVLPIGEFSENINHPIVGTWHCSDNDGYISAYTVKGQYVSKNTNPTEWPDKNKALIGFGTIAVDSPMHFILLSEELTKEEMMNLYEIVNDFLQAL